MMSKITLQILKSLLIVDVVVIVISIIFFDIRMLLNTQIGFISASLVMLASMKSYKRMVDARVELDLVIMDDSRDVIDKLEDPYNLYSEEVREEGKTLVDTVKNEPQKIKKSSRTLTQTIKDAKTALSLYRIAAYIVFILGFFYLNRHDLLQVPSYILAISLPMLVVVFVLLSHKETKT